MNHGSAQIRPRYVPASTAEGKWAASSSGVTPAALRSRIQPARANSGTQMQSSIMRRHAARRANRVIVWPPDLLSPRLAATPLSSNCGPLPRGGGEGFKKPLAPDGGEGFEKFFLCGRGMRRSFRQGGEEAV